MGRNNAEAIALNLVGLTINRCATAACQKINKLQHPVRVIRCGIVSFFDINSKGISQSHVRILLLKPCKLSSLYRVIMLFASWRSRVCRGWEIEVQSVAASQECEGEFEKEVNIPYGQPLRLGS